MSRTLYTYNAADNGILKFYNVLHPSGPQMRTCTQLQMIIKIEFDKKQETYVVHGPDLLQVFLEMFRFSKIGFSFVERDIVWVIPLIFPLKPEITIDREK